MTPALLLGAALLSATPAQAERTVQTLRDLGPALTACWRAPPGTEGSEVTVRFSLRRDGTLLGQPRITYSKLTGDAERQRTFIAAALGALAECLPVKISDGLGGTIAGRPLTIRFGARGGVTAQGDAYIPMGGYYDE
jgi:hypothetical protein